MIKVIIPSIKVEVVAFEISERAEARQFEMSQGDTAPAVQVKFMDNIDDSIDLTGYAVHFYFKKFDGNSVLNQGHTQCEIVDAIKGIAQYKWQDGDTNNVGIHFGEFAIVNSSGKKQSIRGAIRFNLRESIESVSGV